MRLIALVRTIPNSPHIVGFRRAMAALHDKLFDVTSRDTIRLQEQVLAIAVCIASLLVAALSAWKFAGPYRWLAQAQLAIFGSYSPQPTFLLTWFGMMIPVLMGIRAFMRWRGDVESKSTIVAHAAPQALPAHFQTSYRSAKPERIPGNPAVMRWLLRLVFTLPGQVAMIGAVLVAISLFTQWRAAAMTHPSVTTIQEIEAGVRPTSDWLSVQGDAMTQAAVAVQEHSVMTYVYVPIVVNSSAPPSSVALFVKVPERKMSELWPSSGAPFEGLSTFEGLSGPAVLAFEQMGLPGTSNCIVLELGDSPTAAQSTARRVGTFGLIVFACGLMWYVAAGMLRQEVSE